MPDQFPDLYGGLNSNKDVIVRDNSALTLHGFLKDPSPSLSPHKVFPPPTVAAVCTVFFPPQYVCDIGIAGDKNQAGADTEVEFGAAPQIAGFTYNIK